MTSDEQAIRELISTWMAASKAGDVETVLSLMTDDVVFMVPGKEPFGKEAFAHRSQGMAGVQIDGTSEIMEIKVLGEWAWLRNRLRISITPPGGKPMIHSGYTLTVLQKNTATKWRIARDANLLTPEKQT
jgi:uncharacterized protein (TIGR02246 family)